MRGQLDALVEAFSAMLTGTRLEEDLADLLWSFVNLFHRKIDRIERELDTNEQAQRRGQTEQDGSEVKSVELERLIAQGLSLIERRNAFEFARDHAAELFEVTIGTVWRPRAGSMVNHRALTASVIDSRDFLAARRRAETEVHAPAGARIAFTGGTDCNDHTRIWDALDKIRAKHPDMVLLHGGSPRGAERIAACWADNRKVPQVVFKPDWNRAPQRSALQAQRPVARGAADRRRRVPRLRDFRQPRRQGEEARHPGIAFHRRAGPREDRGRGRRRLGAVFSAPPVYSKFASCPAQTAPQPAAPCCRKPQRLAGALITPIEAAGASYPQAQHTLTRALGALIRSTAENDADRSAAVSNATRAIAICTESASLIAKYGRKLHSTNSRLI